MKQDNEQKDLNPSPVSAGWLGEYIAALEKFEAEDGTFVRLCDVEGAIAAALTASAPNHSEQVRESFISRAVTHYEAALQAAFPNGSSGQVFSQWNEARRIIAAAPSAGSQKEQGE